MKAIASTLRGPALLATAVNRILTNPETWDQRHWHCGSTHCVAGHCQILATGREDETTCNEEVRELLGISKADANWLFAGDRRLAEIHGFAVALIQGEAGFDRAGFNRAGFNRAGKPLEPIVIPPELLTA